MKSTQSLILTSTEPAPLPAELEHFGELGLPPSWSPEQGLNARQAEALRKMLLAVVNHPRQVVDRIGLQLERLRAAREASSGERERLGVETRAVFAPLANRLGVWQLKWELEDYAFRYLQPEEYKRIATALNEKRVDRERYIEALCASLKEELQKSGVQAEVYGRPKHIYSIYRKMQRKGLPLEQIFDLRAVRIIVNTIPECYTALSLVHTRWRYIPQEFDDYIATPKENAYRSIHTAVVGPKDKVIEVQIRTREMHEKAELGVSAHWQYKEGGARDVQYQEKIEWARRLLAPATAGMPSASAVAANAQSASTDEERDYLESLRTTLFADRVFAFTPKGEVVELPQGATPLDFAYHVHTSLGHRCRGAKVNGRIVPLTYKLKNGEIVEIITGKQPAPSRDWLNPDEGYLASPRSRSKLRAWFRKLDEAQAPAAHPEPIKEPEPLAPLKSAARSQPRSKRLRSPVDIEGVGDLPTTLARCCAPLRPQPIAGYVTLGRGVTIHRSDCRSFARMRAARPDRVLQVSWTLDATDLLSVELAVTAHDRPGLARDVGDIVAFEHVNIEAMTITTDREAGTASVTLRLAVHDREQLTRILQRLSALNGVIYVRRSA